MTTKNTKVMREGADSGHATSSRTASIVESHAQQGPWSFERTEYGHAILMGEDAQMNYPGSFNVNEVIEWEHDCSGAQWKAADARVRLIAAAPDLLAALKAVVTADAGGSWRNLTGENAQCALKAIARAEGRQ